MDLHAHGHFTVGGREFPLGVRTYIVGIINVTPDSFSDGGCIDPDAAAQRAREMVAQGADMIDIGAESTRPGSVPLPEETEKKRLLPALERVRKAVDVPISVDTYKAGVAAAALAAGAELVNDISGFTADPKMAGVVAAAQVPAILMHWRPFDDPFPGNVWDDIIPKLRQSIELAQAAGIPKQSLIVDPGFGFGKTDAQNLQIVRELSRLKVLGCPVLLGPSRKSTIGRTLGLPTDQRVEGTAALVALAIAQGVDFIRVHDVLVMKRCADMADAVVRTGADPSEAAIVPVGTGNSRRGTH